MTRVLVCGGRDYFKAARAFEVLDGLRRDIGGITQIIHGGATGADALAATWARAERIESLEYKAAWKLYGKRAGPIRNQKMIDEAKPDLVVAFPGGSGTADMVGRARAAGLEVIEVDPLPSRKHRKP